MSHHVRPGEHQNAARHHRLETITAPAILEKIKDQVISDGLRKELATFQKTLAKGLQPGLRTITSRTCLHLSHKHHTSGAAEVIDVRY